MSKIEVINELQNIAGRLSRVEYNLEGDELYKDQMSRMLSNVEVKLSEAISYGKE